MKNLDPALSKKGALKILADLGERSPLSVAHAALGSQELDSEFEGFEEVSVRNGSVEFRNRELWQQAKDESLAYDKKAVLEALLALDLEASGRDSLLALASDGTLPEEARVKVAEMFWHLGRDSNTPSEMALNYMQQALALLREPISDKGRWMEGWLRWDSGLLALSELEGVVASFNAEEELNSVLNLVGSGMARVSLYQDITTEDVYRTIGLYQRMALEGALEELLGKLIAVKPDPAVMGAFARILLESGRNEKALLVLRMSDDLVLAPLRAEALEGLDMYFEAYQEYKKAYEANSNPWWGWRAARAARRSGEPDLEILDKLSGPGDILLHAQAERIRAALVTLARPALVDTSKFEISDGAEDLIMANAEVHLTFQEYSEAFETLRAASEKGFDLWGETFEIALMLGEKNNFSAFKDSPFSAQAETIIEAFEVNMEGLRESLKRFPSLSDDAAGILVNLGRKREALEIVVEPLRKADLLIDMGRFREARDVLTGALSSTPSNPLRAKALLLLLLEALPEKPKEAELRALSRSFDKSLEAGYDHEVAVKVVERIRMSRNPDAIDALKRIALMHEMPELMQSLEGM